MVQVCGYYFHCIIYKALQCFTVPELSVRHTSFAVTGDVKLCEVIFHSMCYCNSVCILHLIMATLRSRCGHYIFAL